MISKALEEYLKTMYILQIKNKEIRVTDIAIQMECSKPSVNKAINNLKENNLVEYETYGKIELTEKGIDLAKKILEAYDISYIFFKDVIGLEEEAAKKEAEKLKLIMEDNTINKLAKYVHKVLDLEELNCNYDISKERCRSCKRRNTNKIKQGVDDK
jgi:DtxR family Mn-dependent transcriptional regulator